MKDIRSGITFILFLLSIPGLFVFGVNSGSAAEKYEIIYSQKAAVKPIIDGNLDEETWHSKPVKADFISYSPFYGEKLPFDTLLWVANDSDNLYFAFQCADPQPDKIQTSLTKRDGILGDDYVVISLDAVGNGQTAYAFYINPNGIQADSLVSSLDSEDFSPDFVWESAGKITDSGYQVEICLPLKSIAFKSGKEVRMGVLFKRKITRFGNNYAWPDIKLGHNLLDSQTKAIFKNLKTQLKLEILPSVIYDNNRRRISGEEWVGHTSRELGISLKYGLTSSITADFTVNPDFSQVESDAFQVEINQRYPLFFSEKRSFFMEGMDIFNFYTISSFFAIPVHTRLIVDPAWGAKITGSQGKMSFGILSASDQWPGQQWETGTNPHEGKNALFGIARGKYSLGRDNYIGFLYSGRDFAGEYNRVLGMDFAYRPGKGQRFNISMLHSFSGNQEGSEGEASASNNFNLYYKYDSTHYFILTTFEHIGTDFRMDTAYITRNGINSTSLWSGLGIYPKIPWVKLVDLKMRARYVHDLHTRRDDLFIGGILVFYTTQEGAFQLEYNFLTENWQGQEFNLVQFNLDAAIRLNKWLKINGTYSCGDRIYYEGNPAFKGKANEGWISFDIQPTTKINQFFQYTHSDFSGYGRRIYDVNIFYSRTRYQFNRFFFLRAVFQYNSYQKRLLTDFLASFTLIPGTVIHVGYGGLYERRKWQNNQWVYQQGDLMNIKRSFFLKASYLWRF